MENQVARFQLDYYTRCVDAMPVSMQDVLKFAQDAGFDELAAVCNSWESYQQLVKELIEIGGEQSYEQMYLDWLVQEGYVTDVEEYWADQREE